MSLPTKSVMIPRIAPAVVISHQAPTRKAKLLNVDELLNYIKVVHNIDISDSFVDLFSAARSICYDSGLTLSTTTKVNSNAVGSIIEQCTKWKKYLYDQDDFYKLVYEQLISMVTAHTAVLSTHFSTRAGIQLVSPPENSYAVIIYQNGHVKEIR